MHDFVRARVCVRVALGFRQIIAHYDVVSRVYVYEAGPRKAYQISRVLRSTHAFNQRGTQTFSTSNKAQPRASLTD